MKPSPILVPALLTPHQAFVHYEHRVDDVVPVACKATLAVTIATVDMSFRAISPRLQEVPALLPKLDLPYLLEMPNLVRAVSYAAGRVVTQASSGEIARNVRAGRRLRAPMLYIAEGLAAMTPKPVLPAERVAKIRAGRGSYDTARDLTDLVGLYREFATDLAGKHPFDDGWFETAEELGVWLQQHITPEGAASVIAAPSREAADLRDRLWGALLLRDAKLRVLARVLFENEANEKVPPLRTRVVKPSSGVVATTPEPETQPEVPAKTIT